MIRKETRFLIYRKTVLILAVIAAALIQNQSAGFLSSAGLSIYFLIPLTVSIAMFEHEFSGMFFGLLGGALWDLASPLTDGVCALYFTVFACVCGLLTHYLMRNTLMTAALFTAVTTAGYTAVHFAYDMLHSASGGAALLRTFYLPAFILTVISLPVSYYFVKLAEKAIRIKVEF